VRLAKDGELGSERIRKRIRGDRQNSMGPSKKYARLKIFCTAFLVSLTVPRSRVRMLMYMYLHDKGASKSDTQ